MFVDLNIFSKQIYIEINVSEEIASKLDNKRLAHFICDQLEFKLMKELEIIKKDK